MFLFLKEAHNKVGLIILVLLFFTILFFLIRFFFKKTFGKSSRIISLITLTVIHIQLSLGVLTYILSPLGYSNFSGEAMKHEISRFYIIEHPVGMILVIVLATFANRAVRKKKYNDKQKYSRALIFYTLAFALTYYLTPWFLWS